MKIIHTLHNTLQDDWVYEPNNIRCILLSYCSVRENYRNIHLYADQKSYELIKDLGLEYDSVTLDKHKDFEGKNFGVPKIITYADQTEPFLHIDHDTFLFKHFHIPTPKKLVFSHPDKPVGKFSYNSNQNRKLNHQDVIGFYRTYVKTLESYPNLISKDLTDRINFGFIPNMCIFGGNDWETISEASRRLINLYNKNQEIWDSNYYNACVIEQLLMIPMMSTVDGDYSNLTELDFSGHKKSIIYQFTNHLPLSMGSTTGHNENHRVLTHGNKTIYFESKSEYDNLAKFDFNGFLHLSYMKQYELSKYIMDLKLEKYESEFPFLKKIDKKKWDIESTVNSFHKPTITRDLI